MEIITRKYAKSVGLPKYYTGKSCIHGHNTYRYTKSGTCSACVAAANTGRPMGEQPHDPAAATQRRGEPVTVDPAVATQLREYDGDTVVARVRVYECDGPMIVDIARGMLQARFPALNADLFRTSPKPLDRAGGTALYPLRCHPEDRDALIATGCAMIQGRNDGARVAERIYKSVLARSLADADAEHPGPPPLAPGVLT